MKKNADRSYEKTKPIKPNTNPTCSELVEPIPEKPE